MQVRSRDQDSAKLKRIIVENDGLQLKNNKNSVMLLNWGFVRFVLKVESDFQCVFL